MNERYNGKLTKHAKRLRREMTKEERHLWYDYLKTLPVMVHRQKGIGAYIVDFYIASANLVIEIDGSQHYEKDHIQKDMVRDAYLKEQGFTVLRYSNADINLRFSYVCQDIYNNIYSKQQI